MTLSDESFQCRTFSALNITELYQILQLRNAVFVLEQNCPYLDIDNLDQAAWHLFQATDQVVAYARILPPDQAPGSPCSIGRVVVDPEFRAHQLGRRLMQAAIEVCQQQFPEHPIKISAQSYLSRFYQSLGFVVTGAYYLEDQIPHQEMIYQPS
ncbi:GNAT family N-acetyltransferase [Marinicella meishanensis]|uniref:GNAT family N-acetyltransferase n=1 Tax=Marinicella meishanensis TaxID=2873263 RepID=UPI001CBB1188|nr:GNAT family N-acetyltransferase [Marinicella sp. NBU2979]